MSKYKRYQYYVEGETEKKLIEELKKTGNMILSGSVNVFNVKQKELTSSMLANLSSETTVIMIFDTDTKNTDILHRNIATLRKCRTVKEIWCVMQVKNLEDELIRATNIKEIRELTGSKSNSDFKRDLLREKGIIEKLNKHGFNYDVLWETQPGEPYLDIRNCGAKIKLSRSTGR